MSDNGGKRDKEGDSTPRMELTRTWLEKKKKLKMKGIY
jgi:hypothetical protein